MRRSTVSRIFDIRDVPLDSKVWIRREGIAFMNDRGPVYCFKDKYVGGEELVRLGWKYEGSDDMGIATYSIPPTPQPITKKQLPLP